MAEAQKHTGGCHCGEVRYEVTGTFDKAMQCNCSICQKKGYLLTFVPAEQFKLSSGESNLTKYQFNKKAIDHLFCSTCGIQSFARGRTPDGKQMVSINVRCLDDVDLSKVQVQPYDGKHT